MADVQPFRALRYGPDVPLGDVVAPPYDVISDEQRERYLARDPRNVVHLTLPESPEEAAARLGRWLGDGTLVLDEQPALWWVSQEYEGPDGVRRTRDGFAAAVAADPYERRTVLPHERTHAGPREGRLRLLRAVRTQLEPIFLLYDAPAPPPPSGEPELEVDEGGVASRLWRIADPARVRALTQPLAGTPLLIADGHHRYETAVAYRAEEPGATHTFAVLVSARDRGLEIFPTHRTFREPPPPLPPQLARHRRDDPLAALREIEAAPYDRARSVLLTREGAEIVEGEQGELDVQLVDRLGHGGIGYTPAAADAVAAVADGAALAALVRPTRIEDVFALAARGEVMPQKSTYFFPKLTSGLLFFPL